MKISIITVCCNAKDTIEETFISVLNQTYKNIEIVIIDGVSSDGTLDVINKYKDKIAYFISESDDGIYDAMNKGVKAATGDFIMFLNANDVFYNETVLEKVAGVLDKNPDIKCIFGDADYVSIDKKTSKIQAFGKITNSFSLLANNICHQSIFYHKSLFEDFGLYSEDYKIYADWDFNIKCLAIGKAPAAYIPIPIAKFQLGGACSNESSVGLCKTDRKLLIEKYYNKYKLLIKMNSFLKKHFKSIYCPLKHLVINPIIGLYAGQRKYLLNVKTAEINA